MDIKKHVFSDEDVTLRNGDGDSVELDCNLADIRDMKYITLNKRDIVVMAGAVGVTADDMIGELTKEQHDFMFAEPYHFDEERE